MRAALEIAVRALNEIQMTHDDQGSWLKAEQALEHMKQFSPLVTEIHEMVIREKG